MYIVIHQRFFNFIKQSGCLDVVSSVDYHYLFDACQRREYAGFFFRAATEFIERRAIIAEVFHLRVTFFRISYFDKFNHNFLNNYPTLKVFY